MQHATDYKGYRIVPCWRMDHLGYSVFIPIPRRADVFVDIFPSLRAATDYIDRTEAKGLDELLGDTRGRYATG